MKSFLNLFLLFGFFSIPSFGLIQRPSLDFYRIFLFNIIVICGIFFHFRYIRELELRKLVIVMGMFILFITASIIWSVSKIDTLAYLHEVYFTFLFFLLLSFMDIKIDKVYKILIIGCLLYIIFTIFGEIFLRNITVPQRILDNRLQGISGVHFTKIYLSVIFCYLLSLFLFKRKIKYLIPLLITIALIILTLQRTVIASMIISSLGIYYFYLRIVKKQGLIKFIIFSLLLIFIGLLLIFNYQPLKSRSFLHPVSMKDDFHTIISSIDFKGRIKIWGNYKVTDVTFFGTGFNTVPFISHNKLNIQTDMIDLHNDYIKLCIEIGIIGFFIYIIMLIKLFLISVRLVRFNCDLTRIFALASIGILTFYLIFSVFDNAISYIDKSLLYALMFIVFSIKARKNIFDKEVEIIKKNIRKKLYP